MKLASYLDINGMTDAEFARRIGVGRHTVGRYRLGERFPHPDVLSKIHKETKGAVTANDFANLPPSNTARFLAP
jgi:transcriptional regulator with XRE-family HTH domain